VALGFLLAGCGSVSPVGVNGSASPLTSGAPSSSNEPEPSLQVGSPAPSPITNAPIPTANGWVTYINHKGELTFSAPATWMAVSCEEDIGYLVAVSDPPAGCGRGEYYSAWLFGVSLEGDQRSSVPPLGGNYISVAPVTGSQDVILSGSVHGIRYTATETRDGMIGAPKGTTEIYYLATTASGPTRSATSDYQARPTDRLTSIA